MNIPSFTPTVEHCLVIINIAVGLLAAALFVWSLAWGLKSQKPGAALFRQWFGGAVAAAIDGFIDGMTGGGPVAGAVTAAADGQVHADLNPYHLMVEALHILAVPLYAACSEVRNYRKQYPFPNVFAKDIPPPAPPTGGGQAIITEAAR